MYINKYRDVNKIINNRINEKSPCFSQSIKYITHISKYYL